MKKILLSSWLVLVVIANLKAQNPKRFIFLEHFTNTVCSVCANKNPPFFDQIADYPNDIHHISIHPPVPYTTCEFYNENTFENEALAINYGINGTPKVYMWGTSISGSSLLPDATLQDALDMTSPISIIVSESGTTERNIDVTINAFEAIPASDNNRLFVAIVEGTVNYNAPNGEGVHHNVFRKLLTPVTGVPIGGIAAGENFDFNGSVSISSNYVENEIYAIAWVQNVDTKEVLNSGASFDPIINSTNNKWGDDFIFVYPNPTSDLLRIEIGELNVEKINILNIDGKSVLSLNVPINNNSINISHLNSGIYFINIVTTNGIYSKKITKL